VLLIIMLQTVTHERGEHASKIFWGNFPVGVSRRRIMRKTLK
jgi:hypothetical protein